jgi:hypothetical protein
MFSLLAPFALLKRKKSKIKRWNLEENEKFHKRKCAYF